MIFDFKWVHFPINKALEHDIEKYILSIPYMHVCIELHHEQWVVYFDNTPITGTPITGTPNFTTIESAKNWIETDISVKFNAFIELNKQEESNFLSNENNQG